MPLWDAPAPELARGARPNAALMSRAELRALVQSFGEQAWRGDQVFEGIYRNLFAEWGAFTNLSKALRQKLTDRADIVWPEIIQSLLSGDGSTKHGFRLSDGKEIEGVHMPYANRTTLCLSSQIGCAMGCTFCATGQMGILRNLLPGEIVAQVMAMLHRHGRPERVYGEKTEIAPLNIVFMGMGEPLHNLDNLMAAFEVMTDPEGLAMSPKRITVSTSGLVSGIEKLGSFKKRPRLALSLNATTDAYRSKIMPVNRVWNLRALSAALEAFPLQTNERITLEYVLLKGVTDSLEDGKRLVAFARAFPSKVNLIPFNPHEGSGFEPPDESRVSELCRLLSEAGVIASVRRSRGQDVAGACGQLVRQGQRRSDSWSRQTFFELIEELQVGDGTVSLQELLDHGGAERIYGLGLSILSVASFIPGVANVLALGILILGAQMVMGRAYPWLPRSVLRYELHRGRIKAAFAKVGRLLERLGPRRLPPRPIPPRLLGLLVTWTALLLSLPILLPFSNVLPAAAILLMGVALLEDWPYAAWLGLAGSLATTVYFALSFDLVVKGLKAAWHLRHLLD